MVIRPKIQIVILDFFRRRYKSFLNAARGVRILITVEVHAKIHFLATILVGIIAWGLNVSSVEWCMLLLCVALVWVSESLNTALEFSVDLTSPEYHPLAGKAKDVAAGAVLMAAVISVIVGGIIFIPKILT